MSAVPDYVPMLVRGATSHPEHGGCLVQIANWLADPTSWTDSAHCVDSTLMTFGIMVNDCVGDDARHRLALQAPRMAGTSEGLAHTQALKNWAIGSSARLSVVKRVPVTIRNWDGARKILGEIEKRVLVVSDIEAVEWFESLVDRFHQLARTQPQDIAPERWLEVKKLVHQ